MVKVRFYEAVCAAPAEMSAVLQGFLYTRCGVHSIAEVVYKSAVATRCAS